MFSASDDGRQYDIRAVRIEDGAVVDLVSPLRTSGKVGGFLRCRDHALRNHRWRNGHCRRRRCGVRRQAGGDFYCHFRPGLELTPLELGATYLLALHHDDVGVERVVMYDLTRNSS